MKDNTDEQIKNIVRELKNTYGTFTWWIDNDHSIDVEIPPELFEAFTQSLQKYGEKVREEEVEFLKRIKLEVDANVCSCGEEWKDTDIHDLISDRLTSLTKQEKGQR